MSNASELHAKFFGKVQGVGMRAQTRSLALELGLKGHARNCRDGSVEVVAQGPKAKLEEIISRLKSRFVIDRVTIDFKEPNHPFESFEIL